MNKKKKHKEEVYVLTPKGWIELIRINIRNGDYLQALGTCDSFDKWCDKHLVLKEK